MRKRQFTAAMAAGILIAPMLPARSRPSVAPPLLLALKAPEKIELSRYLVSEKFDGVRAYWDGSFMQTRHGQRIEVPASFAAHLPKRPLDGELWMGRGRFEAASAAVRRLTPLETEWEQLRYMVFELPGAGGTFEQRYETLRGLAAAAAWPGMQAVLQSRVGNGEQLNALLRTTVSAGGEGLMLHVASAPYTSGRSDVLLKLKPEDDEEAVVLAHVPGHGRLEGLLGGLVVRNSGGRVFTIGTGFSDAQRREPPPIGSTVTYRFRGTTRTGLPRFASYLRQSDS